MEERVVKLISLYKERPCLYDTKPKIYFNRDKRKKILKEIAGIFGKQCHAVAMGTASYYNLWEAV